MPMITVLGQGQSRGQRLPPESNLAARGHFDTTALPVLNHKRPECHRPAMSPSQRTGVGGTSQRCRPGRFPRGYPVVRQQHCRAAPKTTLTLAYLACRVA